jgi:hypothetical protein
VGLGTARARWHRGLYGVMGTIASWVRGGRRCCGPRDGVVRRRRGLGNGVGCTTSWAWEGQCCCELRNGVARFRTAPAWLTFHKRA